MSARPSSVSGLCGQVEGDLDDPGTRPRLDDEAEFLGHLQHGRVLREDVAENGDKATLAGIGKELGHQGVTEAAALEVGADEYGELRPFIVRVGDQPGDTEHF